MSAQRIALVIGATGGVGGETARALQARGWRVRSLHRAPEQVSATAPGFEWVRGDGMDPGSVIEAARGSEVIFHGANPPGYRNWRGLALPMLESTIAASRASGARILFPGTVYNYGPDAGAVVAEDAPQNPLTRKGAIRVAMERRLNAATVDGVRSLILRAGDYFGARAGSSWFAQGMVRPGRPLSFVIDPGRRGVGHAWAYLPDVAQAFARLAEADGLGDFERFHFSGHWVEENRDFAEAAAWAAGRPRAPIIPVPWPAMRLAAPFNETVREMLEMRYLWRTPLRLDNARLTAVLGREPHTPLADALRTTLEGLGCVPQQRCGGELTPAAA